MTTRDELFEQACEAAVAASCKTRAGYSPYEHADLQGVVRAAVAPYVAALDAAEARAATSWDAVSAVIGHATVRGWPLDSPTVQRVIGIEPGEATKRYVARLADAEVRAESAEAERDRLRRLLARALAENMDDDSDVVRSIRDAAFHGASWPDIERIARGDEPVPREVVERTLAEATCAGSGKAYERVLTSYPPQFPCPACGWTTFTPNANGTMPPHAPKGGT